MNYAQQLDALTSDYHATGMSYARARAQAHIDMQQLIKAEPKVEDKGEGQTMHSMEAAKPTLGGRFANLPEAKPTLTGAPGAQVPRLAAGPWTESAMLAGPEQTSGDVSYVEPVGTPREIEASVAA